MLFQHDFFFSFQKDNREEEIRKKLRKSGGGGGLFCMGFFSLSLLLLLLLLFKKKRKRCEHQISGPKLLLRESIKFRDAGRLLLFDKYKNSFGLFLLNLFWKVFL